MSAPSPKFQKLLSKLRELFELDKADLDFGLYRVLRARRDEIDRFLREDLLPQVRDELGVVTEEKIKPMESKVQDEIANVMKYGGKSREEAEASPTVLGAKALLEQARNPAVLEDEVYSLLTTFFGRYYEAGDFISQRRYSGPGKERYMLPYNGEEVKLVWANMDQYYIKSAENFRDYTFRVPALEPDEAVPEPDTRPRISFRLVEADTEKDNAKATTGKRLFALASPEQFAIERATEDGLVTLRIPFTYAVREKDHKQDDLLAFAEDAILAHTNVAADLKKHLGAKAPTATRSDRTLLAKHLEAYAAKNSFDYFIHKDLGGFLGRELDYFLKSEVLRMDDLLTDNEHQRALTLKKARAFKKVAEKIITFLHRQEQFQKKLWLKKKFVVSCDYLLTLDLIPEEFYPIIAANEAQREEWVRLHAINEVEQDTTSPGYSTPLSVEFLNAHQNLSVDTRLFDFAFRTQISEGVAASSSRIDGVLVNTENGQGLRLIANCIKEETDCVYIDPPYNTGEDGFNYRDEHKSSSWISMMKQCFDASRLLLKQGGVLFASIDDNEFKNLWHALSTSFGPQNYVGTMVWKRRSSSGLSATPLSLDHEYLIAFSSDARKTNLAGLAKTEADYQYYDERRKLRYASSDLTIAATKEQRPNQFFTIENPRTGVRYEANPHRVWRFFPETMKQVIENDLVIWPDEADGNLERPRYKTYFDPEEAKSRPLSSWIETASTNDREIESEEAEYLTEIVTCGMNSEGGRIVNRLFGSKPFAYPKPLSFCRSIIRAASPAEGLSLDFFAGSGTTAHAVINLNREDGGRRKYLLVEMGEHFDTVLLPRIKKVVYSPDWKEGKPLSRSKGISHCVKILKLESYEDCLNNLVLTRNPDQEDLLKRNRDLREDYLLGYFLDVETRGSVLKLDHFRDPWNYRMKIATGSVGETRETAIDLVETFNWLLGLTVRHQSAIQYRRPDKGFAEDEHGRLQLISGLTRGADPAKDTDARGFQTVEGTLRTGENVLVIWRSLTPAKDGENAAPLLEEDNVMLESFLSRTGLNPREKQWDLIYVNGDHTLDNLAERLADEGEAPRFKVRTIEPEFHRLMFEGTEN